MARVEAELNSKLEMARAELSRNAETYKQYRARARVTELETKLVKLKASEQI
ncbi:unnamed protein product, partial [Ascophyllum nodosum]